MPPALDLPPPANAGSAEPRPAPTVEDVDELTAASSSSLKPKFSTGGLIYPPPDIRTIVDKTASFVARNGASFEAKIKGDERANVKFGFLNEGDVFNAYYKARIEFARDGTGPLADNETDRAIHPPKTGNGNLVGVDAEASIDLERHPDETARPEQPRQMLFSIDLPNITAIDLDIIKLTALFIAQRGRSFASALLSREGRSYQFEFLRPTHSLFGFFNRLVEQYRLVMEPTEDMKRIIQEEGVGKERQVGMGVGGARLNVIREARKRAAWELWMDQRRKKQSEDQQVEKAAFAEIDWQDFVVVSTVEITEQDAHIDLPVPMSLREVETMTMAQKRMAAMIMEEEGADDAVAPDHPEAVEISKGREDNKISPASLPVKDDDEMEMEDSDDEQADPQPTSSRETQKPPGGPLPPAIKIRKDYMPKTLAERQSSQVQTTICPVCKETIPTAEMDEHVKIELLNPRYREQRADLESKRAQHAALTSGADPSRFLGTFARARTDIFGSEGQEETQAKREEEERRRAKEREKIIWDGHAASRAKTNQDFNRPDLVESTIRDYQGRFKPKDTESIGPQGRPDVPGAYTGAADETIDRDAATGATKRSADEGFVQPPPAQRPAYESPNGPSVSPAVFPPEGSALSAVPSGPRNIYSSHPHFAPSALNSSAGLGSLLPAAPTRVIAMTLHLPPPRSTTVQYTDLPLAATVATLRDRIHGEIFAKEGLGASRLKLRLRAQGEASGPGKMLNLRMSLGEVLTLAREDRGGDEGTGEPEEIDVIVK